MNIRHYISFFIKNVIKMLTLLIGVSIAAFMLVSLSPIDPVQANVGATAYMRMTPEKRAQMESYWGKDVPPAERYLNWLSAFLHGDLGTSLFYRQPVAQVVAQRDGLGQILIEQKSAGNRSGDLSNLQCVRKPRSVMVADG